ncbi:MAG: GNAT family N-acetyltransferase [Oscillospiraceae bacterium]|jgi:predicted acetyltransferase|nr:GNAT family N-acetyltransferase [Oscillospiraceae bacterium]
MVEDGGDAVFRVLTPEERPQAEALWRYSFQDDPAFISWYFARRAGDVLALGQGEVRAQAVTVPVRLCVRGCERDARILSGVTTAPAYRGQGYMGRLLAGTCGWLHSQGVPLAALYPFDYDFYRRWGWTDCGRVQKLRVPLARLSAAPAPDARVVALTDIAGREQDFLRVYEAYYGRYWGCCKRDAHAFALRMEECALQEGRAALILGPDGPEGYLFYHVQGDALAVDEWAAATHRARRAGLAYLAGHASTLAEAHLIVPEDDPLPHLLPDSRGLVTLQPHTMLRIIDLQAFIDGLPARRSTRATVTLTVRDDLAPWNRGCWRIGGRDGLMRVYPVAGDGPAISIQALTRWLMGECSAQDLVARGAGLPPHTVETMDDILVKHPVCLPEMY